MLTKEAYNRSILKYKTPLPIPIVLCQIPNYADILLLLLTIYDWEVCYQNNTRVTGIVCLCGLSITKE